MAGFYSARNGTIPPLPWPTFAPPFSVLLGNPSLGNPDAVPETRFKTWWLLVASAVENAAKLQVAAHAASETDDDLPSPNTVRFRDLFLTQEEDDEEGSSLAEALSAMGTKWSDGAKFKAADLLRYLNDTSEYRLEAEKQGAVSVKEFLFPTLTKGQEISVSAIGKRLKKHVGEPVKAGDTTLILKDWQDPHGPSKGALDYYIDVRRDRQSLPNCANH